MTDFKPVYILKLLHIIHYRLSVDSLVELGLEYSQIVNLLSQVIQEHLVEDSDEKGLVLTDEGLRILEKLSKEVYPANSSKWILPLEENRVPKISKFAIYLPKKKKFG